MKPTPIRLVHEANRRSTPPATDHIAAHPLADMLISTDCASPKVQHGRSCMDALIPDDPCVAKASGTASIRIHAAQAEIGVVKNVLKCGHIAGRAPQMHTSIVIARK